MTHTLLFLLLAALTAYLTVHATPHLDALIEGRPQP